MNIKKLLQEEFESELKELNRIEVGSEQYKVAVDGTTKIADRIIKLNELEIQREESEKNRENETDLKMAQMEEDRKGKRNQILLSLVTFGLGMIFTNHMSNKSMRFEKDDSFSSTAGREWNRKATTFFKGLF